MKSPPIQYPDDEARRMVEDYICAMGRKGSPEKDDEIELAAVK